MSKFGWSLPPGCGRLPGEEPDPPCEWCGKDIDVDGGCDCEPCQTFLPQYGVVCETPGCVEHKSDAQLVEHYQRASHVFTSMQREIDRRAALLHPCRGCKKNQVHIHPGDDSPMMGLCEECAKEWWAQ